MKLPNRYKVAIVGRPNVGKSSIFNVFLSKRLAIVDAIPGVTRDRIYGHVSLNSKEFDLIDTGGIFEGAINTLEQGLLDQVDEAIAEAHLLLFVVDVKMGFHPMDAQIYQNLRMKKKPILFIINKVDDQKKENHSYEFLRLGVETFYPISALHRRGFEAL